MNCIYRVCIILVLFIFGSCKVLKLDKGKKDQRCCNDNITHHTVKAPVYGIGAMVDMLIDSVDCVSVISAYNDGYNSGHISDAQSKVYDFNNRGRHYISVGTEHLDNDNVSDGEFLNGSDNEFDNPNKITIVYHLMANFDPCLQDPVFCGQDGLVLLIDSLTDYINKYEIFEYDFKFIAQLGSSIPSDFLIEDWYNELLTVQNGNTFVMPIHAYMLGQMQGISHDRRLLPFDNKIHTVLMISKQGLDSFTFNPEDYNGSNGLYVQDNFIALSDAFIGDFDKVVHSLGHFFNLGHYTQGYRSSGNFMNTNTNAKSRSSTNTTANHFNLDQRQAIRQSAIFQRNYLLSPRD